MGVIWSNTSRNRFIVGARPIKPMAADKITGSLCAKLSYIS
jgi:hypothetical protein